MVQQNEIRRDHLKSYTSHRHYHIEYHGFRRSVEASMDVEAAYDAASGKTFRVVAQSGSRGLIDHVLNKLLETEKDDSKNRDTALIPSNYKFNFLGNSTENDHLLYEFEIEPRVKNKLLYKGKIWLDAEDYAVVRIEAQPAENPSFWIKSTEIHATYAKTGEFWLPEQNRSESNIRIGGTATLTIDYGAYQIGSSSLVADRVASNR